MPTFGLIGQKQAFSAAGHKKQGKNSQNGYFLHIKAIGVDMPYFWPYRPKVGISGRQPRNIGKNSQNGYFFTIIYRGQICPTSGLTGQKQVFPAAGQGKWVKKIANLAIFYPISCRVRYALLLALQAKSRYFRPLGREMGKKQPTWAIFLPI